MAERFRWAKLRNDALLEVRLRDLGLRLEESPLAGRVARLHGELEARDLRFRPYVWLSTGWFTPHGLTGFAAPFYLADPRLLRLERRMMLEAEGGSLAQCMQLLRHEAGHAIDNAYRLSRRASWRRIFGHKSAPYHASYAPRRSSRRYVLHLDNWYAQSHPVEDFAETFAVWLTPRSAWRRHYAGWPALQKLEYVDQLMRELAGREPLLRTRERTDALPQLRYTLGEYYRRKKAHYGEPSRAVYDSDLRRLFSDEPRHRRRRSASSFLRERRVDLRREVVTWTGQHPFVVDEVLRLMIVRCRELRLRLRHSERETGEGAAILVTAHSTRLVMRYREYWR